MQDQSQLEALCQEEVPELQGDAREARRDGPFRIPVTRILVITGVFAAVLCIGGLASSHSSRQRFSVLGLTILDSPKCAWGRMNCNETKCCGAPGLQCYDHDGYYAQCRESCVAGAPDPVHWDPKPWSCKELGTRSPGEPAVCAQAGENCNAAGCCAESGFQCYQKNDSFASCRRSCHADGPILSDVDGGFWSCKVIGERAPEAQAWVMEKCSKEGDSCLDTKCCQSAGQACFTQNEYWGVCKAECNPDYEEGWKCDQLGVASPPPGGADGGKLAPWVLEKCSKAYEGCYDSRCCLGMNYQCYQKAEGWGQCMETCDPGFGKVEDNVSWSCEKLGPRSIGLAVKGSPSLYCFSVINPNSYEVELMIAIHQKGASIFACDGYDMLSQDGTVDIDGEQTTSFPGAQIIGSVDGTAGNTELFVHAWQKVVDIGKWKDYAFTIKIDPDCVFIPEKARWHLGSQVGTKSYVINCAAWNMIYGSIEVFTYAAMQSWGERHSSCNAPADFGEDKYMTQCMDHLNVMRVDDFAIVGDSLCGSFTDCRNLPNAAFHPFKDVGSWMTCWQDAMNVLS